MVKPERVKLSNGHFYEESIAPIFKREVQSQVPINKDKMVFKLLFFRLMTSNTCLKVLSRNCIKIRKRRIQKKIRGGEKLN